MSQGEARPDRPGVKLAALLAAAICAIQLYFAASAGLPGLVWGQPALPGMARIGVTFNDADNLEYASFAEQAAHGHILMTDLFTTRPHSRAFFNPYFLVCGWIARIAGLHALTAMALLALFSGPGLVVILTLICRELALDISTTALAIVMVLFRTGPSALIRGVGLLLGYDWHNLGIDTFYFDLYPCGALVVYPYQSICYVLSAGVLLLILKVMKAPATKRSIPVFAGCGLALCLLILTRPYQSAILTLVLGASLALRDIGRGTPLRRLWPGYAVLAVTVLPALLYVVWLSRQPVWQEISRSYRQIPVTESAFIVGFAAFWLIALVGIVRAIRHSRPDFLPLCIWAAGTMAAAVTIGPGMSKFADGSVIALGVLGAYGVSAMTALRGAPRKRRIFAAASFGLGTLGLFGSSITVYAFVLHVQRPAIDAELIAASAAIAEHAPGRVPVILTDCAAGNVIPAYSDARVLAGQWAFSPAYTDICRSLRQAGLDAKWPGQASRQAFNSLVAAARPDFILVQKRAPSASWLGDLPHGAVAWQGSRWILINGGAFAGPSAALR